MQIIINPRGLPWKENMTTWMWVGQAKWTCHHKHSSQNPFWFWLFCYGTHTPLYFITWCAHVCYFFLYPGNTATALSRLISYFFIIFAGKTLLQQQCTRSLSLLLFGCRLFFSLVRSRTNTTLFSARRQAPCRLQCWYLRARWRHFS